MFLVSFTLGRGCGGGLSNKISLSTSFALKFWSNKNNWDRISYPPSTPCFESLISTKAHFIFGEKYFTDKRILYECKYLEDCPLNKVDNCFDTSSKKYHIFSILLSKIAKNNVWNNLKRFFCTQIFSTIKN